MNIDQVRATVYSQLTQGFMSTLYTATCDIVEYVETTDAGGLPQSAPNIIQSGVACRIVEIKQQTVNGDMSATRERDFTLYLRDTVPIKENYTFTNFVGTELIAPDAVYKMVMSTEKNIVTSGAGGLLYTIKGLKRIDKNT